MPTVTRFARGTYVQWATKLGGSTIFRQGEVLAFIPRGVPIPEVYPNVTKISKSAIYSGLVTVGSRTDRYLIRVERENSAGVRLGSYDYYTPLVSRVTKNACNN